MPWNHFFDPLVGRYIRARLETECRIRGTAAEMSRSTGFSRAHISNIIDGTRRVGDDFAAAISKYWKISQTELHRLSHESTGSTGFFEPPAETHPNLKDTIQWCRGTYPNAFLDEYDAEARRHPDRSKPEWLADVHTKFYRWVTRQPPAVQRKVMHVLAIPLPPLAGVPLGEARGAKVEKAEAHRAEVAFRPTRSGERLSAKARANREAKGSLEHRTRVR